MGVFIFILIILALWLLWPVITRWIRAYTARKAEDMIRRMAGMPSRSEEEKARKRAQRQYEEEEQRVRHRGNAEKAHRLMKEYAVDAEFTEIKEYSEDIAFSHDNRGNTRVRTEEQVSDAEYVILKKK